MKPHQLIILALSLLTPTSLMAQIDLGTLTLDARSNIWGAGQPPGQRTPSPGGGGGGVEALVVSLPVGANRVITFHDISGTLDINYGGVSTADGIGDGLFPVSYNGLSGILLPRFACLIGVFTSDSAPTDPAPPTLDFSVIGNTFIQISPQINQTFYVGDGRTGYRSSNGTIQRFRVPDGATKLYLGIPDVGDSGLPGQYNDNTGSLRIRVELSGVITPGPVTAEIKDAVALCITGTVGAVYTIEVSTDLTNWADHEQIILATSPQIHFSIRDGTRKFFRVKP